MLNNPSLRQHYKQERLQMQKNNHIGYIILAVVLLSWASLLMAGVVRLTCIGITAVQHLLK